MQQMAHDGPIVVETDGQHAENWYMGDRFSYGKRRDIIIGII